MLQVEALGVINMSMQRSQMQLLRGTTAYVHFLFSVACCAIIQVDVDKASWVADSINATKMKCAVGS